MHVIFKPQGHPDSIKTPLSGTFQPPTGPCRRVFPEKMTKKVLLLPAAAGNRKNVTRNSRPGRLKQCRRKNKMQKTHVENHRAFGSCRPGRFLIIKRASRANGRPGGAQGLLRRWKDATWATPWPRFCGGPKGGQTGAVTQERSKTRRPAVLFPRSFFQ